MLKKSIMNTAPCITNVEVIPEQRCAEVSERDTEKCSIALESFWMPMKIYRPCSRAGKSRSNLNTLANLVG